jgi:hypothetical protein
MKVAHPASRRLCAIMGAVLSAAALVQAQTTNVVTNGSFESGITGWTVAKDLTSPAGTCGFNVTTAPGTETTTSTVTPFAASDGVNFALGGATQTAFGQFSCTIYQDVVIPANAATATLIFDGGVMYNGGKATGNAALFWGLYPAGPVPGYLTAKTRTFGSPPQYEPASSNNALQHFSYASVNVAGVAGQTLRLAFIDATDSTTGNVVVGLDNVQLLITLAPAPPVPTLGVWGMLGLGGGLLVCGWWLLRRRNDASAAA